MFQGTKTTKKQKRTRMLLAVIIVSSMFLVRILLIQNGTIHEAEVLTDEELQSRIPACEVTLKTPAGVGRGTVILVQSSRKKDTQDTVYIITTAEIAESFDDSSEVIFEDGEALNGTQTDISEDENLGIVSVTADGKSDCSYSEDTFYQKESGSELVWTDDDGNLQKGTFLSENASYTGYENSVLTGEGSADGTSEGAGLYDPTGTYLGLLLEEDNGTLIAVPADQVYSYFRLNH